MGSYTYYTGSEGGISSNFGFRAGLGLSEKTDLKFRYEYMSGLPEEFLDEDFFYSKGNYFSLIPKFSLGKGNMALLTPLSLYQLKLDGSGASGNSSVFSLGPTFLYTFDLNPNKIDFTAGARSEVFFGVGSFAFFGLSAGAGFSSDLSKWAIRPEIGYLAGMGGGGIFNIGIATQFYLNRKK
jgi:hypothetical protein